MTFSVNLDFVKSSLSANGPTSGMVRHRTIKMYTGSEIVGSVREMA